MSIPDRYMLSSFADLAQPEDDPQTQMLRAHSAQPGNTPRLFHGPIGCGKTSIGRLLIRSIYCHGGQQPLQDPCGECELCKELSRAPLNGTMLKEWNGLTTSIDRIVELWPYLISKPLFEETVFQGSLIFVDDVHLASRQVQLWLADRIDYEQRVHFIFTSSKPDSIQPRLMDRLSAVKLSYPTVEQTRAWLQRICDRSEIEYETDALDLIATRTDARPRQSYYALFECIQTDGRVTVPAATAYTDARIAEVA